MRMIISYLLVGQTPVDATTIELAFSIAVFSNGQTWQTNPLSVRVGINDTPSQMKAKAKAELDQFVLNVTGSAPPAGTKYFSLGNV